jgi:hypothetical protein
MNDGGGDVIDWLQNTTGFLIRPRESCKSTVLSPNLQLQTDRVVK